jgi:hypothetical protein
MIFKQKDDLRVSKIEDIEKEFDYYLLHIPEEVKSNDWH